MIRFLLSILVAAALLVTTSPSQTTLVACGYHKRYFPMQQVPSSWWSWQENSNAMALWNKHLDLYRDFPSNGTWGRNQVNEFAGWPTSAVTQKHWGFSWGAGALAVTVFTWQCQCCELTESDIAFNPNNTWTSSAVYAETNPSSVHYMSVLLHELGHSWGYQTINENYDYGVPSVMHAYYPYSVHPGNTIHASGARLIRKHYANKATPPPLKDMAVFSHFATKGLSNSYTTTSRYPAGSKITVHGITVENPGTVPVANPHIRLYLSTDRVIASNDTPLGDWSWTSFAAESQSTFDLTGSIPATTPTGQYFVGAFVTSDGYSGDNNWENDTTYLYGQVTVDPRLCFDDPFEPNDIPAQATAVTPQIYSGLQICKSNQDWYQIQVPQDQGLDVAIIFSHAAGNLDLELYDASLNLVDFSYTSTDGEAVTLTNAATGGSYYVHVTGIGGAENRYTMQLIAKVPQSLTIESINPSSGVVIAVNPADRFGIQGGITPFVGSYWLYRSVNLTAPQSLPSRSFRRWHVDGIPRALDAHNTVVVTAGPHKAVAEFVDLPTLYGAGCTGSRGVPAISVSRPPSVPGVPMDFKLDLAPASANATLLVGLQPTAIDLTAFGLPSCWLLTSGDFGSLSVVTDASGRGKVQVPMSDPSIAGWSLQTQWVVLDPSANAIGVSLSRGLKVTFYD